MRRIDVRRPDGSRVVSSYVVDDVLVDPGPAAALPSLLEHLDAPPRALLLTHVHLDHAAAAGALVARWPGLEVWVHRRGARHLVDPSRLLASAGALYGDDMARLWGAIEPVPERNVVALDGEQRRGAFTVLRTPGHARHHLTYLHHDSGTAFAGDVAGVRIGGGPVLPPVPPPDVDLHAWERSLAAIERHAPRALALGHFGVVEDVEAHLAGLRRALAAWDRRARELEAAAFLRWGRGQIAAGTDDPAVAGDYAASLALGHAHAGLRHWHQTGPVR